VMDRVIARSSLAQDATAYRAIRDETGGSGLLEKLKAGPVTDHGFQSWTSSRGVATEIQEMDTWEVSPNSFVMEAHFPAGMRALNVGGDQKELIVPRGSYLIYRGKLANGNHKVEVDYEY